MSYIVTNKVKRPIVCPLGDKTTLRLPVGGSKTITDKQLTDHISNLAKGEVLKLSKVEEKTTKKKSPVPKSSDEEKEEK